MKINSSCLVENESRRVFNMKREGQIHGVESSAESSVIITNVKLERQI